MRGLHLFSIVFAALALCACEEPTQTSVRVRRVPNPPAYRVSDVTGIEEIGPILRRAASIDAIGDFRLVRQRPGYALVLRDASPEEASALAAGWGTVAIETERRAGSTLSRFRVTRAVASPVALPAGTLVVSIDPLPPEIERVEDDHLLWVQISDTLSTFLERTSLEETTHCVPASTGLSQRSLLPESFDDVVIWVALADGRVAGVAQDPFADETHVTVQALSEEGCLPMQGSLYTMRGRLADLTLEGDELVLIAPDGTRTRWQPQPGLSTREDSAAVDH